ncbi:MAG: hypothetical protein M3Q58_03585 [Bacteroidota bacterium]|nr:hypothetical protein [Bacteroidota bacterium]
MKSVKIETLKFLIWLENDILFLQYKKGADVEIEDIYEYNQIINELGEGKRFPMLIDARLGSSVSPEARDFAASPESANLKLASAIVVNTFSNKLIANFYINFNKPVIPVKVFSSINEALDWLKQFHVK